MIFTAYTCIIIIIHERYIEPTTNQALELLLYVVIDGRFNNLYRVKRMIFFLPKIVIFFFKCENDDIIEL